MNKLKNVKRTLGNRYIYQKNMSEKEIRRLLKEQSADFSDTAAVSLTAGCVKIEAVIYKAYDGLALAYDVFVKDTPGSIEWICYDNLTDTVSFKESDMFAVLDRIVERCGLSYTECNFETVEGKESRKSKPPV